jgi:hypothetical protein
MDQMPKNKCYFYLKSSLSTNELEIRTQYEHINLTTSISNKKLVVHMLTINYRVLRAMGNIPKLSIIHGRWMSTYGGCNYKVVSVQGDYNF